MTPGLPQKEYRTPLILPFVSGAVQELSRAERSALSERAAVYRGQSAAGGIGCAGGSVAVVEFRRATGAGVGGGLERWAGGVAGELDEAGSRGVPPTGQGGHRQQPPAEQPIRRGFLGGGDRSATETGIHAQTARTPQKKYLTPLIPWD